MVDAGICQPTGAVPGMYPQAWVKKLMTVPEISRKNDREGDRLGRRMKPISLEIGARLRLAAAVLTAGIAQGCLA